MKKTILTLDVPTKNNNVYSIVETAKAIEHLKGRPVPGTLEFIKTDNHRVPEEEIAFYANDVRIEDNLLVADIEILKTPNGTVLQDLLDQGTEMEFRPGGFCRYVPQADGTRHVTGYYFHHIAAIDAHTAA